MGWRFKWVSSFALDLRNGKTGVDFLSTSHEQDRAILLPTPHEVRILEHSRLPVAFPIELGHPPVGKPNERHTNPHETEEGCSARNAGPDGPEDPRPARTAARVWHRPTHRADQRRPAFGQSGHALSRPAQAGAGGCHS